MGVVGRVDGTSATNAALTHSTVKYQALKRLIVVSRNVSRSNPVSGILAIFATLHLLDRQIVSR